MKKNKKKIVVLLLVLLIVLVITLVINKIEKEKNKKIELGSSIYEKIHNLYYYGGDLDYKKENDKYVITNYSIIENIVSNSFISKVNKFLNIEEDNNKYYINPIGKGISNYYGTILKIKKISKNKIEYKAMTKMCKKESIVSYGDRCTSDGYYEIEKPFIIIKEDNKWKVLEYTSIFQFSERELK